jgi:hypothetical protein
MGVDWRDLVWEAWFVITGNWHSPLVSLDRSTTPEAQASRFRGSSGGGCQLALAPSAIWTFGTEPRHPGTVPCVWPWQPCGMTRLPSLYKARDVSLKSPVCAICLDRTRGKTFERELTHGVRIWLCAGHHSAAFLRANAGRDFVVTLMRSWRSNGCLTRARSRALDAHLAIVGTLGRAPARRQPGSYAWPRLRREAEECFALGERALATITRLRERHALDHATVPSVRTMRRWFAQGRWLRFPSATAAG